MKALSIKQPWAGLIIAGIKNIENRSWSTHYTGQLVIVSTKAAEPGSVWDRARRMVKRLGLAFPNQLCSVNGAALGIVTVIGMVGYDENGRLTTSHPTAEPGDFTTWWNDDLIGWILEHPRALPSPVPVKGQLGLYNLPADVEARIKRDICHV